MIRCLSGMVVSQDLNWIVIDVNGVGYQVFTSEVGDNFTLNENTTLYTYLSVRETALDLYGFRTEEELEIFELLITLPKIGPKSASQILHQADISLLKKAVFNKDSNYLSKMSGIGKKSAEKIVTGLGELFEKKGLIEQNETETSGAGTNQQQTSDTIDALVTLGYSEGDARMAVLEVTKMNPETTDSADLLKQALKFLSK